MLFYDSDENGKPEQQVEPKHNDEPWVVLRLRVKTDKIPDFLKLYRKWFLPVDKAMGRRPMRFFHETRSHFNITFMYQYTSWDSLKTIRDDYVQEFARYWSAEKNITAEEAEQILGERTAEIYSFIQDDEKDIFLQYDDSQ